MTSGPADNGDDGSVDVEAAWADIVAHWDDPADPPAGPGSGDAPATARAAGDAGPDGDEPGGDEPGGHEPDQSQEPGGPPADHDGQRGVDRPVTGTDSSTGLRRDRRATDGAGDRAEPTVDRPGPQARTPDDGGWVDEGWQDEGWQDDGWDQPRSRVGGERARDAAAREEALEAALDDDRYHPPEPPPLPRGDLVSRLAWAGVLGAPLFFLLSALFWRSAPVLLVIGAVVAFIGGFATLVVRMPDRDDDEDDGAVV